MTGIPSKVLREIIAVEEARNALVRLSQSTGPVQYSTLRRELEMHAETFKRVLARLEHHGMVGRRLRGEPNNLGHREVFLEATRIGRFWAERWQAWERETEAQAKVSRIPLQG